MVDVLFYLENGSVQRLKRENITNKLTLGHIKMIADKVGAVKIKFKVN